MMKEKNNKVKVNYFHTIIDKYKKRLDKLDVNIKDNPISKREREFNILKKDVEKEFDMYKKPFLLVIREENCKDITYICGGNFMVDYHHEGWLSGIKLYLNDCLTNELIDVTVNSYVVFDYDKDIKFMDILEDFNLYKLINDERKRNEKNKLYTCLICEETDLNENDKCKCMRREDE